MTDPIADLINRLKNASVVRHKTVTVPYSKMKEAILSELHKNGYVRSYSKKGRKIIKSIEIELLYNENSEPRIHGAKRLSRPSQRVYYAKTDIFPVLHGRGLLVLSTPEGVLSGAEARKRNVGGEALFKIW